MNEDELFAAHGVGYPEVADERTPDVPFDEFVTRMEVFPNHDPFWERVRVTSTCWLWTGPVHHGRGRLLVEGVTVYADRYVFTVMGEPLAPEEKVRWHCSTRRCVRIAHLWLAVRGAPSLGVFRTEIGSPPDDVTYPLEIGLVHKLSSGQGVHAQSGDGAPPRAGRRRIGGPMS